MYAVMSAGGKQYKVSEGDFLRVEKMDVERGEEVVFDDIRLVNTGDVIIWSSKELEGKRVTAKVVEQAKAKKVIVGKYKKRKNYRRKIGHRQPYTGVIISKIEA